MIWACQPTYIRRFNRARNFPFIAFLLPNIIKVVCDEIRPDTMQMAIDTCQRLYNRRIHQYACGIVVIELTRVLGSRF